MSMLSDAEVLWMCDNAYSEEEKVEARCEAYSRGLFDWQQGKEKKTMKKIVDGRVYDTDMAATVTTWNEEGCVAGVKVKVSVRLNRKYVLKEGVAPEDALKLSSWGGVSADGEKIDRTRGEFFLTFETGAWDEESKRVVPVSDDEAKSIVERRCSFEEYVRWFGDPRGLVVTPEAVRKAVDARSAKAYEEECHLKGERDAAKARVGELEAKLAELEAKLAESTETPLY